MLVPHIFGPGDLRLHEVEPPRAGPRDAVLRVASVGVCGSDLGYIAAGGVTGPATEPVPLGHELSGVVAEVGSEVRSVAVGDRVILNPLVNAVGNGGPEGGFGDRLLIRDVAGRPGSLLPLPAAVSMEMGALVEPLAVGVHAVRRLGAEAGDRAAVFGAGPIGLASIVALRRIGVEEIVAFDLSPFRRERAIRLGAKAAYDPRETPPAEALKAEHGTTPLYRSQAPRTSRFMEASGSAAVLQDILGFARMGSAVCIAAVHKKPVPLDLMSVMTREITLTGSIGYPTELGEVLDMLAAEPIELEAMISHRFRGAEVLAAFETAQRPDSSAKVLVEYGG